MAHVTLKVSVQKDDLATYGAIVDKPWKEIDNTYDKEEKEDYEECFDGKLDDPPAYYDHNSDK